MTSDVAGSSSTDSLQRCGPCEPEVAEEEIELQSQEDFYDFPPTEAEVLANPERYEFSQSG
jgi:hypothetical protein